MTLKAVKHVIPLGLLLIAASLAVFNSHLRPAAQSGNSHGQPGKTAMDASRFLIRPYVGGRNEIALALDGGALPVAGGKVPSIVVGRNVLRTVHLAWIHDWTNSESRACFRNLLSLYASDEGASLPALRIYLNPVFSDEAGEALHRAMLQAYFRTDNRECYLTLAREISAGSLAPDPKAIRSRIEAIEPVLVDDWDNRLEWLESDIGITFSIARSQLARNSAISRLESPSQLTSMLSVMPPSANTREMIAFLQEAAASQRAWLQAPAPSTQEAPPSR